MGKTLFDKVWDNHIVDNIPNGPSILYVDQHLIHEVTSPQAFSGLKKRNIDVFRKDKTVATADHNVPTLNQHLPIQEELSRNQVETLTKNCKETGIVLYGLGHKYQGIVHVIGPELGITQPGMTIVCGDSHTSTHGAFGSIAFGIGTSEVEMVLATQCLLQNKPKRMQIEINGKLTYEYIRGKEFAPKNEKFDESVQKWSILKSDEDAVFDKVLKFDAEDIEPMITYGTNPGMGIKISEVIPNSAVENSDESFKKSLKYMGLKSGDKLLNHKIDYVFIGSCTNSRIEDLRLSAKIVKGKTKAKHVNAWVIPGSKKVEKLAIDEGLNKIFMDAGFEFRQPGCSACLAMNEDKIPKENYCVSTSNRNFEGRQGPGSRTFLASPVTAAISALNGCVSDIREYI